MMLPPDQNPARPEGEGGSAMLDRMNAGRHALLSEWSFEQVALASGFDCIDLGCGGGANLARLLARCPEGRVTGLDYAPTSVEKSIAYNAEAVERGACRVVEGDVGSMPFPDDSFDAATAFETIYFWPDIADAFSEVKRVLKPGGLFMIANEVDGEAESDQEMAASIEGMSVYDGAQLSQLLETAGFSGVELRYHESERWMAVLARA